VVFYVCNFEGFKCGAKILSNFRKKCGTSRLNWSVSKVDNIPYFLYTDGAAVTTNIENERYERKENNGMNLNTFSIYKTEGRLSGTGKQNISIIYIYRHTCGYHVCNLI